LVEVEGEGEVAILMSTPIKSCPQEIVDITHEDDDDL
jgi:hypothetical protein